VELLAILRVLECVAALKTVGLMGVRAQMQRMMTSGAAKEG